MSFSRRSLLSLPLVAPLALSACKSRAEVMEIIGLSMGTTYKVIAVDQNGSVEKAELEAAIAGALAVVNAAMSNWDDGSEISRINAGARGTSHKISAELSEVMAAAQAVNAASAGRFDTTIGPLIEAWGFGAPGGLAKPSEDVIEAALARSGHHNALSLSQTALTKAADDTQIYLAGIGKGYGADYVGRAIEALGISDYMVEIGGDLYAAGRNPDGLPWQIGIEAPRDGARALAGVVGLSGMGLATSGDYRNYFEVDGQRFSHLIDPATGHPVTHATTSATVIASNAMLADAWSTAMLILGREAGLDVAAASGIAVQFIEKSTSSAHMEFVTTSSEAFAALTA